MKVWKFLRECLEGGERAVLLVVTHAEGSSPGRQGFMMAVTPDGRICGSVGGGIMEYNLIREAGEIIANEQHTVTLRELEHTVKAGEKKSGLICAGKQFVALVPLSPMFKPEILEIEQRERQRSPGTITVGKWGMQVSGAELPPETRQFTRDADGAWEYREAIGNGPAVFVFGGGHVGIAAARLMVFLGYYTALFEARAGLPKLRPSEEEHIHVIKDLRQMARLVHGSACYVVVTTHSFPTDVEALKAVLGADCRYIGLMGSEAKIRKIMAELRQAGFTREELQSIKTPIGIAIGSQTAEEIAVSIAAEITLLRRSASLTK